MISNYLVIIICFFPFISFNIIDSDTQVYAYLFCAIFFILKIKKMYKFYLLCFPIIGFLISLMVSKDLILLECIRSFIIYSSPFIFVTVSFYVFSDILKKRGNLVDFNNLCIQFLFFIVSLFGFVALLQFFIDRNLFNTLLINRTSIERGVTSLTPEPSMYGLNLLLLGIITFLIDTRKKIKKITLLLILFQIIFLSQSALVVLTLTLILITYLLFFKRQIFLYLFILILPFITVLPVFFAELDDGGLRILNVVNKLFQNPYDILYSDGSLAERFYHVFLSFDSYGVPQGLTSFFNKIERSQNIYDSFWWGDPTNKIMSGIGSAFWEIGVFSLPLIFFLLLRYDRKRTLIINKQSLFITIALFLICLQSISYSMPLISIVLSYSYFINHYKKIT